MKSKARGGGRGQREQGCPGKRQVWVTRCSGRYGGGALCMEAEEEQEGSGESDGPAASQGWSEQPWLGQRAHKASGRGRETEGDF